MNAPNAGAWFDRLLLPRIIDRVMRSPAHTDRRRDLLAHASGGVLELGFGTALNLAHYPDAVGRVIGIEPNLGMHRRAMRRVRRANRSFVAMTHSASDRLPFRENTFDCVVSTWTLCSVPDPIAAVAEAFRVLKPGGRFLFVEHGLAPTAGVAGWQRRLTPLSRRLGGGCRLDRDMSAVVRSQPFDFQCFDQAWDPRQPRLGGYLTTGVAIKPA